MKILIVEDEPQTAAMLKAVLLKVQPDAVILDVLDSITGVTAFLKSHTGNPDLIFMDIQLSDGLSFEIFRQTEVKSPVVFCTAYDQYMLQAFKSNGIEYLLKPVKEEDVANALKKFASLRSVFSADAAVLDLVRKAIAAPVQYRKTLMVQYRESYLPLSVSNIAVFYVESEILYAYTFNQQRYPVFRPLGELEAELDPSVFFRISRQTLLNRRAVQEIQPYFNRKLSVHTPVKLPETLVVSRLKVPDFMKWMEEG